MDCVFLHAPATTVAGTSRLHDSDEKPENALQRMEYDLYL